jgi:hypothetical protein
MIIAYLKSTEPAPKGVVADLYLNGDYFNLPNRSAKSVIICGDYPKIAEAYSRLKIPVKQHGVKRAK